MNRTCKHFLQVALIAMLTGCTIARYTDETHSLTVIDMHPTGNAVDLDASLTGKGRVKLQRQQGSAEGIVTGVVDELTPSPLDLVK